MAEGLYLYWFGLIWTHLKSVFFSIYGDTLQGAARTFKTKYLNLFSLPEKVSAINEILSIKEKEPNADVYEQENVLNQKVYALYELDDDIKIFESVNRM